jgi:hypothetical protein
VRPDGARRGSARLSYCGFSARTIAEAVRRADLDTAKRARQRTRSTVIAAGPALGIVQGAVGSPQAAALGPVAVVAPANGSGEGVAAPAARGAASLDPE